MFDSFSNSELLSRDGFVSAWGTPVRAGVLNLFGLLHLIVGQIFKKKTAKLLHLKKRRKEVHAWVHATCKFMCVRTAIVNLLALLCTFMQVGCVQVIWTSTNLCTF